MHGTRTGFSRAPIAAAAIVLAVCGCASGPMSAREGGALTGAAVGAGTGAAIGSASGDAAEGALIGGAVGALAGAIIGDSVEASRQRQARDAALAEELRRRDLEAQRTDRGVVVNLPDVLFETGRAELTPDARRKASTIADVLRAPSVEWRRVSIEGHADAVGSEQANITLSERRADAVADALVRRGVDPSRLFTEGFGEAYPVATNETALGRARNRRVEIVILNEEYQQMPPPAQPTIYPAQPGYGYPPGPPPQGPYYGPPPQGPYYGPPPYGY